MLNDAGAVERTWATNLRKPLTTLRALAGTRRFRLVVFGLFVFAFGLHQNLSLVTKSQFHPDESRWINRADYIEQWRHPLGSFWEERYLTRGQPPGGSYITGIGLLLQGRDLETNGPWDFHYGAEATTWWNASRGNMPAWEDLQAARRTSAALGAFTSAVLFLIVARLTNLAGAVVAGLLFAIHPLNTYLSSIAVSDAPFTTIVALTTLAAMALAARPTWLRAAVFGLAMGVGAATKLSPLFLAIGFALIGLAFVASPYLCRIRPSAWVARRVPGLTAAGSPSLGWKLIALPIITAGFFVASYPYLWPAPLGRTDAMLDFRAFEMGAQARIWPNASVDSRIEAIDRTWTMLQERFSATAEAADTIAGLFGGSASGRGYDVPLALAGLVLLAWRAWRQGVTGEAFFALAAAGGQSLLIFAKLRVDFDRYYLPIVFFFAIGLGVLAGDLLSVAFRFLIRRSRPVERRDATSTGDFAPLPGSIQPAAE